METNTAETTVESTTSEANNTEEGFAEARRISEFRLKTLSQLIGVYVDTFSAKMVATNGVSYNEKVQAAKALKEGVLFALDFGLGVTNANIREKGVWAKEVNGLAGTLVQALDTRFILLADNMKRQEDEQNNNQTTVEETAKGE